MTLSNYSSTIRAAMDAANEGGVAHACPYRQGSHEARLWYRARTLKFNRRDWSLKRMIEEMERRYNV